jgi:hypothetical protein
MSLKGAGIEKLPQMPISLDDVGDEEKETYLSLQAQFLTQTQSMPTDVGFVESVASLVVAACVPTT